jgi:hypothetical protein
MVLELLEIVVLGLSEGCVRSLFCGLSGPSASTSPLFRLCSLDSCAFSLCTLRLRSAAFLYFLYLLSLVYGLPFRFLLGELISRLLSYDYNWTSIFFLPRQVFAILGTWYGAAYQPTETTST